MSDYWEKQKAMKEQLGKVKLNGTREEAYVKLLENSAISFKQMWEEEVAERKKIQRKYDELTRKIKENALEEVNAREVNDGSHYMHFEETAPISQMAWDKVGEFGKLVQERLDDGDEEPIRMDTTEWDDGRMDVIGQNGNDGLHYEEISDEQKAQNLKEYLERLAAFDEYEKDGM